MSHDEKPLHLQRIDPSRNMARFYLLSVQPTLFGETSLVRNWGRIGTSGRMLVQTFEDAKGLEEARRRIGERKCRRGYQPT